MVVVLLMVMMVLLCVRFNQLAHVGLDDCFVLHRQQLVVVLLVLLEWRNHCRQGGLTSSIGSNYQKAIYMSGDGPRTRLALALVNSTGRRNKSLAAGRWCRPGLLKWVWRRIVVAAPNTDTHARAYTHGHTRTGIGTHQQVGLGMGLIETIGRDVSF
jgi:hypothetical protein